jgi:hypothetical protein
MRPQLAYAGVMLTAYCGLVYGFSAAQSVISPNPQDAADTVVQGGSVGDAEDPVITESPALIPGKFSAHSSWISAPEHTATVGSRTSAPPPHSANYQAPRNGPARPSPQYAPIMVNGRRIIPNDFTSSLNQSFYQQPQMSFSPRFREYPGSNRIVARVRR